MRSQRLIIPLALAAMLGLAGSATAGWNNVFQVTCNDCQPPRVSYSIPASPCPPEPCPQPEARVSYVQRCYYQPVTEYKRESYYVPVKENVTSYYWEPVTSYSYTSYYDPCSCSCQQIATPRTSYRLRSQCNSVTRYVEKCRMVPVTSYRQVTMYQPVVTYYYPPSTSMYTPALPSQAQPRVEEQRSQPPTVAPGNSERISPPDVPTAPGVSQPRTMPSKPENRTSNFARTASRSLGSLRGEVVKNDQISPRANTKIVFLSAEDPTIRKDVVTNDFGEFDIRLTAGEWYVYLGQGTGRAEYYKKLTIRDSDYRNVTLVSR